MRLCGVISLLLPLVIWSEAADATLIARDLSSPGDQLITFDTKTGLAWLDLTLTKGYSYSSIINGAGGWTTHGWRYATGAEIGTMWASLGITNRLGNWGDYGELAATQQFFNLFGSTSIGTLDQGNGPVSYEASHGITGDLFSTGKHYAAAVALVAGTLTIANYHNLALSDFVADRDIGSFLVRPEAPADVPEPGSLALLLMGIATLTIHRLRLVRGCKTP